MGCERQRRTFSHEEGKKKKEKKEKKERKKKKNEKKPNKNRWRFGDF
jgi:hypothetical protein